MLYKTLNLFANLFLRKKYFFIGVSLAFNIFLVYFSLQVKFDNSIWLEDSNIHKKSKDRLYKIFDKGEELVLGIDLGRDYFNPRWIQIVGKITEEIEKEDGVVDVKSPLNATVILKKNGVMNIISYKKAMEQGLISSIQEYKNKFTDSNYYGQLVSKDYEKIAIVVKIKAPIKDNNHDRRTAIMKAADRILSLHISSALSESHSTQKGDFRKHVHYTGEVTLSQVLVAYTQKDLALLLPLSIVLILLFLFLIYRKLAEVLIIIYISLISITLSFFIFFLFGFPMNAISISLPILMLDISYGLSIYVFNRWHETFGIIQDEREAIATTFREVWKPCLFTILAAAIGFGSFYHSELIPLSNYSACSVVVILLCFPIVVSHLYYFLSFASFYRLERFQKERYAWIKRFYIKSYYKFTLPFRYLLLSFSVLILGLTIYSFNFIRTETNFIDAFFTKKNPVRKDFNFVDQYLGGTGATDILVSTKEKDHFKKRSSLEKLMGLEEVFLKNEVVNSMRSYLTPLSMMHKAFSSQTSDSIKNEPKTTRQQLPTEKNDLPVNDAQLAQEVLFMEFSRGDKQSDVLSPYVNFNYTDSRIHLQTPNLNSERAEKLKNYINKNLKDDSEYTYSVTGSSMYFQALSEYVNETQIESILISLIIAIVFFVLQFGFKLGMIGLLPNVIPILMTVSLIVLLGMPFDFATVIIFSISFSMCVDDTLHFMHFYKNQKKIEPYNADKRIEAMLSTLGRPAFFTSSLFLLGISVFILSDLVVLVKFGIFTLNSLLFDYLSNIFILPAFIKIFDNSKT